MDMIYSPWYPVPPDRKSDKTTWDILDVRGERVGTMETQAIAELVCELINQRDKTQQERSDQIEDLLS